MPGSEVLSGAPHGPWWVRDPTREQRRVAVLLADQVAAALDDESA